ncbi:2-phospho-L-lactate transferase CofD family protein [Aeromicrobium wangtongii]|uniref:2-phospho-L-lactate transferase CofD family protein n=1 Tax=Aeromicrobium wangtongii TaxID=2969247 RepID=A0ABY5MBM2_9ACTN|nr:2-phospho-L-lactate transferase CofD family protein [Aeromicrobium wangtongii]MCD9197058.1 2-phospho-L-lactate transferase CofD family protein [Aeromicrobium wangtongii]UUP14559.1 2-phospho-L-lactate transferase CofD family protein [Aeromicrobium wangtongii]
MRITLIIGADGASFAHDLATQLDPGELTVIAPTVRDHWSAWLKACPDLDALLGTPGVTPTYGVADQLRSIEYSPEWQRTSDQVVAHRLVRSELIGTGFRLSDATLAAATRADLPYRLLPMSDDRAELHVVVGEDQPRAIHVDEYLADPGAHTPTETVLVAEAWSVSPAVTAVLEQTDVLVLGPSSRTLAIDPVLRTPGLLDAVRDDLPVLVVDHADTAPADLVRVAGLRAADPGVAEPVPADAAAVVHRARSVVVS